MEAAQREAEKQAKAISSQQQDAKNLSSSSKADRKNQELEKRLKSQSDELQTITEEVFNYFSITLFL